MLPATTPLYQIQQYADGWHAVSAWHPPHWACALDGPGTFRAVIRDTAGQETPTGEFVLGKGTAQLLVDCTGGVVWKCWRGVTYIRADGPVFDDK
jgi:hypothetical protein